MSLYTEDFECPDCGGWATFSDGSLVTRDCDEECSLLKGDLVLAYEEEQEARSERLFEERLSGDWGPLPLEEQLGQARRFK